MHHLLPVSIDLVYFLSDLGEVAYIRTDVMTLSCFFLSYTTGGIASRLAAGYTGIYDLAFELDFSSSFPCSSVSARREKFLVALVCLRLCWFPSVIVHIETNDRMSTAWTFQD